MARRRLYKRLPAAVRRMDEARLLERVLGVLDDGFDKTQSQIAKIRQITSLDDLEDRYLPLVAPHVGHRWRNDRTYLWNRRRIEEAIERHSYKASPDSLDDLIYEHGGKWFKVTDMASMLDIWNRQGGWNRADGVCLGDGLYHPGSYVLEVDSELDFDSFLADFQYIKRAGTVWYFVRSIEPTYILEDSDTWMGFEVGAYSRDFHFGRWNRDDFWNEPPAGFEHLEGIPVYHLYSMAGGPEDVDEAGYWNGAPMNASFLIPFPIGNLYGDDRFDPNDTDVWSPNNPPTVNLIHGDQPGVGTDGAYMTVDSTFLINTPGLTIDMGTPERLLEEPFVSVQTSSALVPEEVI